MQNGNVKNLMKNILIISSYLNETVVNIANPCVIRTLQVRAVYSIMLFCSDVVHCLFKNYTSIILKIVKSRFRDWSSSSSGNKVPALWGLSEKSCLLV
jgi:hypothetical protein